MCQTNEKSAETMKCNCKQLCSKMQNDSLRCAIDGLRDKQSCSNTILRILEAIENLLIVYSCLPGICLLKRVDWVHNNIVPGKYSLAPSEKVKVNMLISELEAFLNNN